LEPELELFLRCWELPKLLTDPCDESSSSSGGAGTPLLWGALCLRCDMDPGDRPGDFDIVRLELGRIGCRTDEGLPLRSRVDMPESRAGAFCRSCRLPVPCMECRRSSRPFGGPWKLPARFCDCRFGLWKLPFRLCGCWSRPAPCAECRRSSRPFGGPWKLPARFCDCWSCPLDGGPWKLPFRFCGILPLPRPCMDDIAPPLPAGGAVLRTDLFCPRPEDRCLAAGFGRVDTVLIRLLFPIGGELAE